MGHIHEKFDFTVSAYIVHDDHVLLIHHKKLNVWIQPGGHIELDEDPDQALWRELEEETGFSKADLTLLPATIRDRFSFETSDEIPVPHSINVHKVGDSEHAHIDLRYYMKASHSRLRLSPDEHNDIKWFSRSELENMLDLGEDVRAHALRALEIAKEVDA